METRKQRSWMLLELIYTGTYIYTHIQREFYESYDLKDLLESLDTLMYQ